MLAVHFPASVDKIMLRLFDFELPAQARQAVRQSLGLVKI